MSRTYSGLLEGDGGRGFPQGVDRRHVDFVREAGEDLGEPHVAAVLVHGVFLHLQRTLVMSAEKGEGGR